MKTCPICGSKAVDMASTCFECLYSFIEHSAEACFEITSEKNVQQEDAEKEGLQAGCPEEPCLDDECEEEIAPCALSEKDMTDIFVELWKRGRLSKRFLSHNGSLYVGSAPFNDVEVGSQKIARRALHIFRNGDTIFVELLAEECPVYLNGKRLEGVVPLRENDALSFEDVRLVLA